MEITRAYKTELDPNNRQASQFERFAEVRRFVFNIGLREWKCSYERGEKPSAYKLKKQFNAVKDDYFPDVRDAPYAITEAAFRDLGDAFKHFFRRVKNGEKPGYPKFKRRANSFAIRNTKVERDRVRLQGVGWVRLKERGYIPTTDSGLKFGTYATITRRAGRWFISIPVYEEVDTPDNGHGDVLGVDLGLHHLIVCSDGATFDKSTALKDAERKIGRLNRELDRRTKGGKNWQKTKRKLQKAHYRAATARKHWLHQISHYLTEKRRPSVIVIEDLNVKGMMSNHHLAKALSDASFGELRRQIEYKAERWGIDVVVMDRWYPSSKTCSQCGCIKDDLTLSDRVYHCGECGSEMDRDLNAARNLAAIGKAQTAPDCPGS
jgi:putative transposase